MHNQYCDSLVVLVTNIGSQLMHLVVLCQGSILVFGNLNFWNLKQ